MKLSSDNGIDVTFCDREGDEIPVSVLVDFGCNSYSRHHSKKRSENVLLVFNCDVRALMEHGIYLE